MLSSQRHPTVWVDAPPSCAGLTSPVLLCHREFFSDENGNLLQIGDTVRYERLADTLEAIATHGADAFYTGRIAEDLIRDVQEAGTVHVLLSVTAVFF